MENYSQLEPRANELTAKASDLVIRTQADVDFAESALVEIASMVKVADAERREEKKPFDDQAKAVQDKWKPKIDRLNEAVSVLRKSLNFYIREQARREQLEQQAQAEEKARKEREKMDSKADRLESQGKTEQAEATRMMTSTVAPNREAPKKATTSLSSRMVWKAEVTDMSAFLKAVADNQMMLNLIEVNQGALNKMVQALGSNFQMPGVRTYQDAQVTTRKAAAAK